MLENAFTDSRWLHVKSDRMDRREYQKKKIPVQCGHFGRKATKRGGDGVELDLFDSRFFFCPRKVFV